MYFIIALALTAVVALFAVKAAGRPNAADAALYAVEVFLVALIALLGGVALYGKSPMNITPREDYSDPFGGTSACEAVTEPDGYDGTWLAPWLSDQPHQVGTVCWHTPATTSN